MPIDDIEASRRLLFGVAIDLVASRAQAGDSVAIEVSFPRYKFIDRDVVEKANLIIQASIIGGQIPSMTADNAAPFSIITPGLVISPALRWLPFIRPAEKKRLCR